MQPRPSLSAPENTTYETLQREAKYLDFVVHSGELIGESFDWHDTLRDVCAAAVETVADICRLDLWEDDGVLNQVAAAHRDRSKQSALDGVGAFLHQRGRGGEHPAVTVARTGTPLLVPDMTDEWIHQNATSPEHEQFWREMHYRSLIIVPVVSLTFGILGALTLAQTHDDLRYDRIALEFARDLGRRCGTAIAKAKLHAQVVEIATRFQQAALPASLPKLPNVHFDAFYEPSFEELLVGGDWFDAFLLGDGRVAITVGDVLGHGIDAAVEMSRLRNGLRAALYADSDPAKALTIGDQLLRSENTDAFATALVSLLDPVRLTLTCASAGHPGPLVWNGGGKAYDPFIRRELPLGLRSLEPASEIAGAALSLNEGAFVLFFTDGLLEWNRNIEEAWERLFEVVARDDVRHAIHPAHAVFNLITGGQRHFDDVAMLTIRVGR